MSPPVSRSQPADPRFQAPAPGTLVEIAPGVLWLRLALPFRLNHVNIYLLADDGGWAVFDAGLGNEATLALWERIVADHLAGLPLTRLIVSHYHPDHIGAAGWMVKRFRLPLLMSQTEYLLSAYMQGRADGGVREAYRDYYRVYGFDTGQIEAVMSKGHEYLHLVTGFPDAFVRLFPGETLTIGARTFEILTGPGHSPEQVMLYCAADKLFLSADHVIDTISPNVSVVAMDPEGDPLGLYLKSLAMVGRQVAPDALVLAGHGLPFLGLHRRIDELTRHHAHRCDEILAACRGAPRSAAELIPVLFPRPLDPQQQGFAFSEVLAHLNYMRGQGRLLWECGADGIRRGRASEAAPA